MSLDDVIEKCTATTLKDAANRAAVRLGYPLGLKCEQLDAFLSGRDVCS